MANLLDIGKSGLLFQRQALGVTSENITNVNTEGYHRRTAQSTEIGGSTATVTTAATGGQGVMIDRIRRAFDQLTQERARTAASSLASAETLEPYIDMLESRLTPGEGGLTETLDSFFQGFGALALSPADKGLRRAAMESAKAFANTVSDTAQSMMGIMDGIRIEADERITAANTILKGLADIQSELLSVTDTGVRNPIMDQRDQLIMELSEIVDVTVEYDSKGTVKLSLGAMAGGPMLVDGIYFSRMTLSDDLSIEVDQHGVGDTLQVRRPTSGGMHGLYDALGAVDETLRKFDNWAQNLVNDFNAEHKGGLDAKNRPGGDLFSLVGWTAKASQINRGTASAVMTVNAHELMPEGPIKLVFDGDTQVWNSYDEAGTLLTQSSTGATFPGVNIEIDGVPQMGDVFYLERTDGAAVNLHFVPTETSQLAVADALRVSAEPLNVGTSTISVRPSQTDPLHGVTDLRDDFAVGGDLRNAITFLNDGTVGFVPADAASVDLLSLAGQSVQEFTTAAGAQANSLEISYQGQSYTFDLERDADGNVIGAAADLAELAQRLNNGVYVANALNMADLGIFAAGNGTHFSLASARGEIGANARLSTSAGQVTSATTSEHNAAADLMVFTREGRQISGPVLSADEAANLINPANGFYDTALYSTETLNKEDGYRGLELSRASTLGDYSARLGANGAPTPYVTSAGLPAPIAEKTFELWIEGNRQGDLTIPQGSSAERMAQLIDERFSIDVRAETRLELQAPANDGVITFNLMGDNVSPIQLSAPVQNGSMSALASAVNILSGQTGVKAEVSGDGSRMVLIHETGENIVVNGFEHDGGDSVSVRAVDRLGLPTGAAAQVLDPSGNNAVRIVGTIELQSQSEFDFAINGTGASASNSAAAAGLVRQSADAAGSTQTLSFSYNAFADNSVSSADAFDTAASGLSYQFNLTDPSSTVHQIDYSTLGVDVASDQDLALGVIAELRENAPTSRITSAPLPSLPADGKGLTVSLGDQTYDIRMINGAPQVSGPEDNRINAYFTANNEFVIETVQGTLNGDVLQLSSNLRDAAVFGVGAGDAPIVRQTGMPLDLNGVNTGTYTVNARIGDVSYPIEVTIGNGAAAISPPVNFPGGFTFDGTANAFTVELDARAGDFSFDPDPIAQAIGFTSYGMRAGLNDGGLTLTSTSGDPINLSITAQSAAGTRISLDNLPNEDLLVIMREPGALRLSGEVELHQTDVFNRSVRLTVTDALTGEIDVQDAETGHSIATRWLDASGTLQVAGYDVVMSQGFQNGDSFLIEPNIDGLGDGRVAENIIDLRGLNETTGRGGFATLFQSILTDVGGQVKTANEKITTARSINETAERVLSAASGVDLDTEAANLIQQQQAYQASAQIISVARQIFETLLRSV